MTSALVDDVRLVWKDSPPTAQPDTALNVLGYWQLGEDDPSAAAGGAGNDPTLGRDANGLNPALNLTRSGSPSYSRSTALRQRVGHVLQREHRRLRPGQAGDHGHRQLRHRSLGATRSVDAPGRTRIAYNGTLRVTTALAWSSPGGTLPGVFGGVPSVRHGRTARPTGGTHLALVSDDGRDQDVRRRWHVLTATIPAAPLRRQRVAIGAPRPG